MFILKREARTLYLFLRKLCKINWNEIFYFLANQVVWVWVPNPHLASVGTYGLHPLLKGDPIRWTWWVVDDEVVWNITQLKFKFRRSIKELRELWSNLYYCYCYQLINIIIMIEHFNVKYIEDKDNGIFTVLLITIDEYKTRSLWEVFYSFLHRIWTTPLGPILFRFYLSHLRYTPAGALCCYYFIHYFDLVANISDIEWHIDVYIKEKYNTFKIYCLFHYFAEKNEKFSLNMICYLFIIVL